MKLSDVLIIVFLFAFTSLKGQTPVVIPSPEDAKANGDTTYTYVGEWPEFPGGRLERNNFLSENLRYPRKAERKRIEGKVIVGFTVQKDGSIADVYIINSVEPTLDEEAMRVVKKMPKWKPGKNEGVPVAVKYILTIFFKLPND